MSNDLRAGWENTFAAARYGLGVNECTDATLFVAAAIAVAAARGARLVTMASEAEVQHSARRGGMVVQMRHFMYSAATQRALSALLAPAGIALASLTSSLRQFQVQRLLAARYPSVRDLQYSCWELSREQAACSRCAECRKIALNLVAERVDPAVAGIDLLELLLSLSDWSPGQRYLTAPGRWPSTSDCTSRRSNTRSIPSPAIWPGISTSSTARSARASGTSSRSISTRPRPSPTGRCC